MIIVVSLMQAKMAGKATRSHLWRVVANKAISAMWLFLPFLPRMAFCGLIWLFLPPIEKAPRRLCLLFGLSKLFTLNNW